MTNLPVTVSRKEGILKVCLNRPRRMNALTEETITALSEALAQGVNNPPEVLVLTGSGRFFCFGVDFRTMEDVSPPEIIAGLLPSFHALILEITNFPAPTLALLNGHAAGAGLNLALAADFRLARDGIKLTEAFIKWGLVPDGGGTFFLPAMVGLQQAKRLALLGEPVTAKEALTIGLVDDVVDKDNIEDALAWWCDKLAALPRRAYVATRRLLRSHASSTLEEALQEERDEQFRRKEDEEFLSKAEAKGETP